MVQRFHQGSRFFISTLLSADWVLLIAYVLLMTRLRGAIRSTGFLIHVEQERKKQPLLAREHRSYPPDANNDSGNAMG